MRLRDDLIEAGTWRTRDELQAAQQCSTVALEDALADLVIEGQITFRENVGYRLAGTTLTRRALQLAVRGRRANPRQRRFMTTNYSHEGLTRFGFAQVDVVDGQEQLTGFELEFDRARINGADVNEQAANLIAIADKFLTGEGAHG